ncbi:MAG: hypothetical protein IPM21_13800 [Acidobacteria bacterium]|nr:hypothetical protein [Acidobacteriota bacterium]
MEFRALLFGLFVLAFVVSAPAQPAADFAAERELARLAVEAHGGETFRKLKTLSVIGSVDVTTSQFPQAIPATFVTIFSGDRYRFELNNPFQPIRQANDGTQTTSTIGNGMSLPPINRIGFPVLQRIGETGFVVTAIPENKKKRKGFRVTSPEGYSTDFFLDGKTNEVKSFDSTYLVSGRTVTTSAEIDKLKLVDGVLVPERYVQRFDLDQFTVYANFKAREIKVNGEVADDVFTVGK